MLRRISLGLLASAISIASLPAIAQEDGSADDLGVMSISLKDVVKPTLGFQGALQGAGTPNQAGIGGFLPLSVGDNSVWFLDVLANANFADYENNSSIINTDVAGTTISTSSRLGYRWLNGDRSWMYGLNAGYDSRPMNTGGTDTGINVSGTEESAFFQQVAVNAEAVSNDWNFNAYALIPIGDTEQDLNFFYQGGALNTYGLDVGYFITPELNASVGYYYQSGDLGTADGSGVLGRVACEISSGLTAGVNVSYDEAFETRVSADLKVRFGGAATTAQRKEVQNQPVISALTSSPGNRDVRVHDVIDANGCQGPDAVNAARVLVAIACDGISINVMDKATGKVETFEPRIDKDGKKLLLTIDAEGRSKCERLRRTGFCNIDAKSDDGRPFMIPQGGDLIK
ncbi:inverse autotransporter beta domain-containing protein [Synechococcus sp. ROS8604]|uniref:inverse autotransporter beta domain-containing protein n=1 Tax=Synechococcus sp. ROS8604 TaxID=1442557 RepID=UPI00186084FC|nr:inverse autotransporter beta domain-containing protein [Synechococcus sp. ROS8604]QNI88865.1 putative carbamoyl-phosphate synthase L chain [Synechococcus sp. ROS8604]